MQTLPNHHAIFAEGKIVDAVEFFKTGLKERGVETLANPDIIFIHHDAFGIEDSRELVQISSSAPLKEEKKTIVLSFNSITREAQNALLKLFEDPNPKSEFLIVGENFHSLLPTLRSRLFVINMGEEEVGKEEGRRFLNLTIGERLKIVEKMLKAYKDEGDKKPIREFLLALHRELEKDPKVNAEALRASAESLSYIDDTSSSAKLLLENAVLSLS